MRKIFIFILTLGISLLLAGCGSVSPKPEPQAEVMTPVYVAGVDVGQSRIGDVRNPESVETYSVGRYVDPNNSHIMYEKNMLYRQKQTSSWNTRPNPPIKLSGASNEVGHINSANDKPLYAELENRIYQYSDATRESNRKYAEMINAGAQKIAKSAAKMKELIDQNKELIVQQKELNKKIFDQDKIIQEIRSQAREQADNGGEIIDSENDFGPPGSLDQNVSAKDSK